MDASESQSSGSRSSTIYARAFTGPSIKAVLVVGLSLTAGIWLFAGYYFSERLRRLESDSATMSRRFTAAQELLSATGSHVDRGSIALRDALLDPHPVADRYRGDVETAFGAAEALLSQYVAVLDSESERDRAIRLRENIRALRIANLDVLETDSREWQANAAALLQIYIGPKREAARRVADELRRLNLDVYVQQQQAAASLYGATHVRLWQTLGLGLCASFLVGLLSAARVGDLERRLRAQQARDARTAVDLQRLSTRLVVAQEDERRYIARELHDEIGQILTAVKMALSHAKRQSASGAPMALDEARDITDRALRSVRDMSHLLHPPELEHLGLPAAVETYVRTLQRHQDMMLEFTPHRMGERLPPAVELAVYRTAQEGVTNVVRHARARTCHVTLERLPSAVVLTVADDGVGFVVDRPRDNADAGIGLIGIRERVRELGGTLRVESTVGRGTVLTAEFPVPSSTAIERRDAASFSLEELAERR